MAFVTDKAELKPGLIIFRRGDVEHRQWYCRMKIPKADRYKTVSLKSTDMDVARDRAFDQDADIRFRLKHDVPVFNHPFREIGRESICSRRRREHSMERSARPIASGTPMPRCGCRKVWTCTFWRSRRGLRCR